MSKVCLFWPFYPLVFCTCPFSSHLNDPLLPRIPPHQRLRVVSHKVCFYFGGPYRNKKGLPSNFLFCSKCFICVLNIVQYFNKWFYPLAVKYILYKLLILSDSVPDLCFDCSRRDVRLWEILRYLRCWSSNKVVFDWLKGMWHCVFFCYHHLFFTQLLKCKWTDENVNSVRVDSFYSCIGKWWLIAAKF